MTKHQLCQFIVKNFVTIGKPNWPQQIKIAKKLIEQYPDEDFWKNLPRKQDIFSLAFYLTEEGKYYLINLKNVVSLVMPTADKVQILDNKIGEPSKTQFKPSKKTLLEFLK